MTDNLDTSDILQTLNAVMQSSDSDTARIQAAKILLERLAPKTDDDAARREQEERNAALDDARGLLAEFAAAKLASLCQPDALAETSATATDNPTG